MTEAEQIDRGLDELYFDRRPATADDIRRLSNELQAIIVRLNDIEDNLRAAKFHAKSANSGVQFVGLVSVLVLILSGLHFLI